MSKIITLVIVLSFIISGCIFDPGFDCGFIDYPRREGSFTTSHIPDQYVALGDTLFLNINEYWEYESDCNEYFEEPQLNSLIIDSREVELHRQENNVFIIGQKTGTFSATIIGSAELIRDHKKRTEVVPMTFNIKVGSDPGSPLRQRATYSSAGRIDSIRVTEVDMENKALRLTADFSPEYIAEDITDLQARWAFYPTTNVDSLKQMDVPLRTSHDFGDDFYFNPDSLYPFYYGYVEVQPGRRTFGKTFILNTKEYFE